MLLTVLPLYITDICSPLVAFICSLTHAHARKVGLVSYIGADPGMGEPGGRPLSLLDQKYGLPRTRASYHLNR